MVVVVVFMFCNLHIKYNKILSLLKKLESWRRTDMRLPQVEDGV